MRAVLMFNLPREDDQFRRAASGDVYFCALSDLADAFRNVRKYGAEPVDEDKFWEILRERGVELA